MRDLRSWGVRVGAALLLAGSVASPVWSQTDDESNGVVVFNFSTPGARTLAMGGAFLGSIDDASAAYSNPAGLLQLSETEVAIEARSWRYSIPFAQRGRAVGSVTGVGVDTRHGVEQGRAQSELSGISFGSVVYPRKNWAAALFFHQVARYETSFRTEGIFGRRERLFPVESSYAIEIQQAGVAYAREWENGLAAGFSLSSYSLDLSSQTQRYNFGTFLGPAVFAPGFERSFETQKGESSRIGFSLGLHWERSEKMSVGLVYRFAPRFEIEARSESGSPRVPAGQRRVLANAKVPFNLPDVLGIGYSYHPTQEWTVNLDFNQVLYSQLIEEQFLFFDSVDERRVQVSDYVLEDVIQVHLGAEYVFSQWKMPLALRFGGWFDPDHRLRVETGPELNQARLPASDGQFHGSVGFGVNLGSHLQLDAAVDFSQLYDTASVSVAVRF